jgi:predicted ArsR family transcriptional regulator
MGIREKYAALERRRDLALRLVARPNGVTTTGLSLSLGVSFETARRTLAELCSEQLVESVVPKSPKGIESPGRPARIYLLKGRLATLSDRKDPNSTRPGVA